MQICQNTIFFISFGRFIGVNLPKLIFFVYLWQISNIISIKMEEILIGRKKEKKLLAKIYNSNKAEFVAVYGRRRVGKTFLIREFYNEKIVFQTAGLSIGGTKEQLKNFYKSVCRYDKTAKNAPDNWLDAFDLLIDYLEKINIDRKVIFLDELPWMDTPNSGFITALEHFWNGWASGRKDIILIVSGSATSWMMNNLIMNYGGLHGRLTQKIFLQPFDLDETNTFLKNKGINLSSYELAECYMILGGIPYYLEFLDRSMSLAQNIDRTIFNPNGELYSEFQSVYCSLFKKPDLYIKTVEALSRKSKGLSRNEIITELNIKSGNALTSVLEDLEYCGFIRKYNILKSQKNSIYQLTDFFTLFYFHFVEKSSFYDLQYWSNIQRSNEFYAWAGYTFEMLMLQNIEKIKQKLGISGVKTEVYAWRSKTSDPGAQIDLVIDRNDNTINLCEIKFCESEFAIDKDYDRILRNKITAFITETKTKKTVQLTMITTHGLKQNMYSSTAQNEVVLEDLISL